MPELKPLGDDYITLFDALPTRVRHRVQDGTIRCSYTALKKWGALAVRKRVAIVEVLFRENCKTLDEALERYNHGSHAQRLAKRQRQAIMKGEVPLHILNSTPPAWSGDMEAFFIPPDQPERALPHDEPIVIASPIEKRKKKWSIHSEP